MKWELPKGIREEPGDTMSVVKSWEGEVVTLAACGKKISNNTKQTDIWTTDIM